jgi:hypothetical protein
MRFRLLTANPGDAVPAAAACDAASNCIWEEAHPQVRVTSGSFTVRLGEQPAVPPMAALLDLLRQGKIYFVEVAVRSSDQADWTTMGRQEISPAPAAVWSAPQDLQVGNLTVQGTLTTENLTVNQGTTLRGGVQANTINANRISTAGGVTLGDDVSVDGNVDATGDISFAHHQGQLHGNGDVDVPGQLVVGQLLTANGDGGLLVPNGGVSVSGPVESGSYLSAEGIIVTSLRVQTPDIVVDSDNTPYLRSVDNKPDAGRADNWVCCVDGVHNCINHDDLWSLGVASNTGKSMCFIEGVSGGNLANQAGGNVNGVCEVVANNNLWKIRMNGRAGASFCCRARCLVWGR